MTPEIYIKMEANARLWGTGGTAKPRMATSTVNHTLTPCSTVTKPLDPLAESVYHYVSSAVPYSGLSVLGPGAGRCFAKMGDDLQRSLYSLHSQHWKMARMLYSSLRLRDEWRKPPREDDGIVEQRAEEVGFISDLSFSPDCKNLVASSTAGDVFILHPSNGRAKSVISDAHCSPVSRVLFVDNVQFVSGSTDCTVKLWDVRNTKKCVNTLQGHTKAIKTMDYSKDEDLLVTSSFDGQLRYWHLPYYQVERTDDHDSEDATYHRGSLLLCPNFAYAAMSPTCKKLVCANSHGVLYVVSNLCIRTLKSALLGKRFDDSFQTQLAWFTPNASTHRQNRMHVISYADYIPIDQAATISKIGYMTYHPKTPLLLMRLSTQCKQGFSSQTEEWLCVCNMQQNFATNDKQNIFARKSFGSDIFEETLLFRSQERRFASFREKRPAFSECGRVIASPDKDGVRIMAFSEKLDLPSTHLTKKSTSSSIGDIFNLDCFSGSTAELVLLQNVVRPADTTICCKFSPLNDFLLAVGASDGTVSFIQPAII